MTKYRKVLADTPTLGSTVLGTGIDNGSDNYQLQGIFDLFASNGFLTEPILSSGNNRKVITANVDWNSSNSEVDKIKSSIDLGSQIIIPFNTTVYYRTIRVVYNAIGNYTLYINIWRELKQYSENIQEAILGLNGNISLTSDLENSSLVQIGSMNFIVENNNLLGGTTIDLGETGATSIDAFINAGPVRDTNSGLFLFNGTSSSVAYSYLYKGDQKVIGTGQTDISINDFIVLSEENSDTIPSPVIRHYNNNVISGSSLREFNWGANLISSVDENGVVTVESENPITSTSIVNSSTILSNPLGGSTQQPNLVGIETHAQYQISDGVTSSYSITASFVINDLSPRISIRANILRKSDGAFFSANPTVTSGYGTNTIIISLGTIPTSGDLLEFTVYGENDDVTATPTLVTTNGYDNSVNSIMSNAYGAHGIIFSGDGHNSILGGSFSRIWGSFNSANGKGIIIGRRDNDSFGNTASGLGNQIDGDFNVVNGNNIDIQGNRCSAVGADHISDGFENLHFFGRKGLGVSNSEVIHSAGISADAEAGLYQNREILFRGESTSATIFQLALSSGDTTASLTDDTGGAIEATVTGYSVDNLKSATFSGVFHLTKTGGVSRINNSTADVSVPVVYDFGTSGYSANLRAISGGIRIRVVGDAGQNVRWIAKLNITQTRF